MDRRTRSLIILAGAALALLWLAPQVFFIVFAGILVGVFLRSGGCWIADRLHVKPGWGIAIFLALIVVFFGGCAYKFAPDVATQVEEFTQQVPRAATPLSALIMTLVDHLYVRQLEHETRPISEKTPPEL